MALPLTLYVLGDADPFAGLDPRVAVRSIPVSEIDATLAAHRNGPFLLGGSGDTGDGAARVAAGILDGHAPVFGLAGLVLIAPSLGEAAGGLDLPALVLAGHDDLTALKHLTEASTRVRFIVVPGAETLLADECPDGVVPAIEEFLAREIDIAPVVPDDWARLIASDRVDVEVRSILARRALGDDPDYRPQVMDAGQLALLREIADLVVPQDGPAIDIAARVDAALARGEGDGWRNAALPPDPEAYRAGLDALAAVWPEGDAEETLRAAMAGELDLDGFDAAQLAAWLEDVRVDLVRAWLAHPATMARAGFDGFATGGTVLPLRGFLDLGAGTRETWEPVGVSS
ncbi:hypothetical protein [Microbacterium sp. P04]|uniref:hypothetical protein n=1 Tax=Microbacterium sp. P04 TaxID=3366947 RepID=UPI003746CF3E